MKAEFGHIKRATGAALALSIAAGAMSGVALAAPKSPESKCVEKTLQPQPAKELGGDVIKYGKITRCATYAGGIISERVTITDRVYESKGKGIIDHIRKFRVREYDALGRFTSQSSSITPWRISRAGELQPVSNDPTYVIHGPEVPAQTAPTTAQTEQPIVETAPPPPNPHHASSVVIGSAPRNPVR